jgi:hypothetical protein
MDGLGYPKAKISKPLGIDCQFKMGMAFVF